ncbi:4-phosphoerythronate dehydrogenase PdxB [Amphritea sp. HPY]|uniref:4-phosphoerythronate dehydrogenase PdxB n=1 Tax=Amphritea sp. HPY TaxID=3421652 RepID=UPI003D7D044D
MNLKSLKIVADENIPAAELLFSGFGEVVRRPGRQLSATDVADADLLLVRSITPVNEALLAGSKVRFVGTATIGTDHIDQRYLQEKGISFASAPGCNADAVTEYVLSVLSLLAGEQGFKLQDKTLGIIGVGNVGGRLQARLEQIGVKLLLNDPPRQQSEGGEFCELHNLLQQADIICMHTPLVKGGDHPSLHLLNKSNLSLIKQGAILLNAGRGPVIDNQDLLEWHRQREDVTLVLDVWEHEPRVDAALAERVRIGTPHIAGYSLDGKIRGTYMLYHAFCAANGIEPQLTLGECLPQDNAPELELSGCVDPAKAIHQVYDPRQDDARFRDSLLDQAEQPKQFDLLRKHYPVRREFAAVKLKGVTPGSGVAAQLTALGFNTD